MRKSPSNWLWPVRSDQQRPTSGHHGEIHYRFVRQLDPAPFMLARRTGICCSLGAWRLTVSTLRVQPSRRPGRALLREHCRPASGRYEWRSRMSRACLPRRARHRGTVPGRQSRRSPGGRLRSRWPRRQRQRAQRCARLPHQSLWTGALCWRDL